NLNALLKHPTLGLLPYDVLKNGNVEEIGSELRKLETSKYRSSVLEIGVAIVFTLLTIYWVWIGDWPVWYVRAGLFTSILSWAVGVNSLFLVRRFQRCQSDLNGNLSEFLNVQT